MSEYAFEGQTIRLNQRDMDQWESVYHAIPDLKAELFALDAFYTEQGIEKWFVRCSTALNKKHQSCLSSSNVPTSQKPYSRWTDAEKQQEAAYVAEKGIDHAVKAGMLRSDIERLTNEGYLDPGKVALWVKA